LRRIDCEPSTGHPFFALLRCSSALPAWTLETIARLRDDSIVGLPAVASLAARLIGKQRARAVAWDMILAA